MCIRDRRIGTLCAIDREPREMTEEQITILEDLAEMVRTEMSAIQLSDINEELVEKLKSAERAAMLDPLSGLWNRRGAEKLLAKEWAAASRDKTPVSIVMIDIDHFKKVNDEHGHEVGDMVIRQFSKTILASLRPRDVVCRWGGEEFLAILGDCDGENLRTILNRIQLNIAKKPVHTTHCLLYTSPSPRDLSTSRMPSSA